MKDWRKYTAQEFCLNVTDGTHDSPKPTEVGHYLITSKHLQNNAIDFSSAYKISEEDYQKVIKRSAVVQHDILFSMIGTIGNTVRVKDPIINYAVKNMAIFKMGYDELKSKWLYYWLKSSKAKEYISSRLAGSTQSYLTLETLRTFPVFAPSENEMQKIVSILSSIDDKIELNRQINDNLEQQAQAIYKSWFMDNFQAHWQETSLADVTCKITDGVHNTVIDCPDGEYFLLSCKNIKNGTLDISSTERKINRVTFNKLRKRTQLGKGDILLTSVGTIGELMLLNEDPYNFEFQRSVAIIKPNENFISSFFLYGTLKSQIDKIKNTAHGAVQQCIFLSDLKEYSIHIPEFELISQYDQIVKPLFDEKVKREKEIKRLTALRDTLLPKLMSGELKINKIDC